MRHGLLALLVSFFGASSAFAASGDTYNFRFSPIGLIAGSITAGVDIAIAPEWTIGPTLNYWHFDLSSNQADFSSAFKIDSFGVGARANWFKNGVYTDGFYVGPSLKYANIKLETKDSNGNSRSGSGSGILLGALVGYGWFWDSFNMMLGVGYSAALSNTRIDVKNSAGNTTSTDSLLGGFDGEFSLGWTF